MLRRHAKLVFLSCFLIIGLGLQAQTQPALGTDANQKTETAPGDAGMLSFVFDDGFVTDRSIALELFKKAGIQASSAIILDQIGQPDYMDAGQIRDLQDAGWEIMSHTVTHPNLRTLSDADIEKELKDSKDGLVKLGFDIHSIVYPENKSDPRIEEMAARYYRSGRGGGNALNDADTRPYFLRSYEIKYDSAQLHGWVDQAASQGKWLILYHHRMMEKLHIGARDGKFITDEPVLFSHSGAVGRFEPTLWNRIGNSLYILLDSGEAEIGDDALGLESGAWAQVDGIGADDRQIYEELIGYVRSTHPQMRILTVNQALDQLQKARPGLSGK